MSFKDQYIEEYKNEISKLRENKPNLMIVGVSGAGKSSLINKIFGRGTAPVGTGKPVTSEIKKYTSSQSLINIFDTMGYEIKDKNQADNQFEAEVINEIERRKHESLHEHIHIIWYCIPVTNHRIFSYDIEHIKFLGNLGISLFIVFTKCDEDSQDDNGNGVTSDAFKRTLKDNGITNFGIYEVSTEGNCTFQLDDLLKASANSLKNKELKNAFIASQLHNLSLKRDDASVIIHAASAAAGGAAAIPIPMADAPILISIQMGMALKLASIYGFSTLGESAGALLKTQIISLLAKQVAASMVKFIPILGSIVNATVAVSFTEALGWGLVKIYENVVEEYLKTGEEPQWAKIFSSDILIDILKNKFS